MSHSVSPRPLSNVPFFVADGVLLLTALVIAWRTPEALAGGALAGVVICTCLGASLMAVPFVLNEARRREAAVEKRQRELLDLVSTTTATASHWGTQWAAAATGLEDAAKLASRNLVAAERLPAAVQEKIEAFSARMERFEASALAREERATILENDARLRMADASVAASELARVLAEFERVQQGLREQREALSTTFAELPVAAAKSEASRRALEELLASAPAQISIQLKGSVEQAATAAEARLGASVERAAGEFERVRSGLREQHEAVAASLAGFVAEMAGANALRGALEQLLTAAPEQISAQITMAVERAANAADTRLAAQVDVLTQRFGELETRLGAFADQLERRTAVVALPIAPEAAPLPHPVATPAAEDLVPPEPPVVREEPVMTVVVTPADQPAKPVQTVSKDTIMDPFYIPDNGYSALAEAMDAEPSR